MPATNHALPLDRDLAAAGIGPVASPPKRRRPPRPCFANATTGPRDEAQLIVALGGDGFMLQTLHDMLERGRAAGVRDESRHGRLPDERMAASTGCPSASTAAKSFKVAPLEMTRDHRRRRDVTPCRDQRSLAAARDPPDREDRISRQRPGRAARTGLRRHAGRHPGRIDRLQSLRQWPDPAARLALLALTPISPFRPRRWRGAILPDDLAVRFRVLDPDKRPVSAVADQFEVRDVATVDIRVDRSRVLTLLFDPEHALDERITMEQFAP